MYLVICYNHRSTSKMASYRHMRDVDSTSANLRVKLTRSSSYAGTVNNGYDHHLSSNNYFRKFKEQDKLRRSGSNFETFGSRYLSNTLKATNKGKDKYASTKSNTQIKYKFYHFTKF